MTTKVDEIAPRIYRLSTLVPEIGPTGFTFNQFLLDDDEPLLFHTGHRSMFPLVREAIERVMPLDRLRWITFGHVESDECGAMNELLAAAPHAEVAHGALGCMVSLNEMADRPPRPLADGEVLELGSLRVRHIDTPHVPHAWEARVLYEETTARCSVATCSPISATARRYRRRHRRPGGRCRGRCSATRASPPSTPATIERLADLEPRTLALMHGSSFTGDGGPRCAALADAYADRSPSSTPTVASDQRKEKPCPQSPRPTPSPRPDRHRRRRQRPLVRERLRRPLPDGRPAPRRRRQAARRRRQELMIVLHRHDTNDGGLFGETTTGLDHAGFVVPTRADLEAWQDHLEANGVVRADVADKPLTQSPIADEPYGSVLVFRDPDNIQLELFSPGRSLSLEPAGDAERSRTKPPVSRSRLCPATTDR